MANKPIKIALLGLGTVGTGVYKLLSMRADDMPQIAGAPIEITFSSAMHPNRVPVWRPRC